MKKVSVFLAFKCLATGLCGQSFDEGDYSKIGKECPEFSFRNVINYKQKNISLSELKGKIVILDFWNTYCAPCIRAMPQMDSLQNYFQEKIQILPIATQMDNKVERLYEQLLSHKKISRYTFPVAKDTMLTKYFTSKQGQLGQYVWIDKDGIVRYYSRSHDLTIENMDAFLKTGKVENLEQATKKRLEDLQQRVHFDFTKPLFVNNNGGEAQTFMYRSILTPGDKNLRGSSSPFISTTLLPNLVQLNKASLSQLYEVAYGDTVSHHIIPGKPTSYGRYWQKPLLEIRDFSLFETDYPRSTKNLFTYSLFVPLAKSSAKYMQRIMQSDLRNYFGYDVKVEERMMPCWKLIAGRDAIIKLKTRSSVGKRETSPLRILLNYAKTEDLIFEIWKVNQSEVPFIDETGISDNIDITIDADISNLNALKLQLRKYDLDLVKSVKLMKVIVIRDPVGEEY